MLKKNILLTIVKDIGNPIVYLKTEGGGVENSIDISSYRYKKMDGRITRYEIKSSFILLL